MLNQVVLVGRLVRDVEVATSDSGVKSAFMTLAVPRSFKNQDGLYDTDFIKCVLWNNVAVNTANYCKKGDIIGIRGRVQTYVVEEDDKKRTIIQIVAEKVTFLSDKKKIEKEIDS